MGVEEIPAGTNLDFFESTKTMVINFYVSSPTKSTEFKVSFMAHH